jgi:diadenosine tetraphosphatase ApaH/serine/threonine PP2A family protein phosphatase
VTFELSADSFDSMGSASAPQTQVPMKPGRKYLINPGSVGQPRDGDPRAAWLLLDLGARRASFRRAEYAIAETQLEIRLARLPEQLAERLSSGT